MNLETGVVVAVVTGCLAVLGALGALVSMGVKLGVILARLDSVSARLEKHESDCAKRQETSAEKWLEYSYHSGAQAVIQSQARPPMLTPPYGTQLPYPPPPPPRK